MGTDDDRYRQRLPGLQLLAETATRAVSHYAQSKFGVVDAVRFDPDAYAIAHKAYWERVRWFKKTNGFPADGDPRINSPKKAALDTFEVARLSQRIFVPNVPLLPHSWPDYCLLKYTLYVMVLYVRTDMSQIPTLHRGDMMIALRKFQNLPEEQVDAALHAWCLLMDKYFIESVAAGRVKTKDDHD